MRLPNHVKRRILKYASRTPGSAFQTLASCSRDLRAYAERFRPRHDELQAENNRKFIILCNRSRLKVRVGVGNLWFKLGKKQSKAVQLTSYTKNKLAECKITARFRHDDHVFARRLIFQRLGPETLKIRISVDPDTWQLQLELVGSKKQLDHIGIESTDGFDNESSE